MLIATLTKTKDLIVWSWSYLWALWFLLVSQKHRHHSVLFTLLQVAFVIFYLRGPLKISENLGMATMFLSTLTPKFYVALTGTSSLISGLILIFEWWYYRRYGTSFIEQVSLNHISPWLGGGDPPETSPSPPAVPECKVWRNPLNLFRGAEYLRFQKSTKKEPLTYYDMNLSAQDHQTFFTCETDAGMADGLLNVTCQHVWF